MPSTATDGRMREIISNGKCLAVNLSISVKFIFEYNYDNSEYKKITKGTVVIIYFSKERIKCLNI